MPPRPKPLAAHEKSRPASVSSLFFLLIYLSQLPSGADEEEKAPRRRSPLRLGPDKECNDI
eukprot:4842319-Alexandrium_andersonii.AAC.1